jgi:HPt (histidine-containing phosphotransfer) domain-containing protein
MGEPQASVLDRDAALGCVGGDLELLQEIGTLFLQECPVAIGELRKAVTARDAAGIASTAHALKGSISPFGTGPAYQAAIRLLQRGRNGDLRHVEMDLADFEGLLERLSEEIQVLNRVHS